MKRLLCGVIALACLALLLSGAAAHPFAPYWPAVLVFAWVVVVWLRPAWWMTGYLALLPVLDLTMFSGWLFFEDFDFITLVVIATGYARFALAKSTPRDSRNAVGRVAAAGAILIGAYGVTLLASGVIGITPLAPLDANAFSNYFSRYNALRLAKAPFAAMLLLPLVLHELRADRTRAVRAIVVGMVAGMGAAGLSVLWERVAFVSLTDLASQYRVTGLFSGTHTGGAALDAYLAITLPFCVLALLRADSRRRLAGSAIVLALGGYSVLVTFSRALYAAVALVFAAQVLLYGRSQMQRATEKSGSSVGAALTLAGVGAFAFWNLGAVFDVAGYRGLAVTSGSFLAVYLMTGSPLRPTGRTLGFLAGLATASVLCAVLVPRGVYLAYALCMALFLAICFGKPGMRLQYGWACALGLSANALAISSAWAEQLVVAPVALGLSVAWAAVLANAYSGQRLWRISAASLPVVLLGGLGLGVAVVTTHSYYATTRFASSDVDMGERGRHWHDVLAAAEHAGVGGLLGTGLGRMPEVYFWRNGGTDIAGTYGFVDEGDNRFLRLSGTRYALGYGDPLRFMQAIRVASPRLKVALDIRTATAPAVLQVSVCVRHLIYAVQCVDHGFNPVPDKAWRRHQVDLDVSNVHGSNQGVPRPVYLVISTESRQALIDVDNVSVEGSAGESIRNGGFARGMDYWFFSSDRSHLAWHAKNMFLHVFFEQGAVGLAIFVLMLAGASARLWRPLLDGDHGAAALAASFGGFVMVGMFDSLLDVPRVSLLFYLLLFASLAVPRRLIFDKNLQTPFASQGAADAGVREGMARCASVGLEAPGKFARSVPNPAKVV